MRVRAVGRGGEQVGIAELAEPDELVTHRCGDQSLGERVGRDGVDCPAATGVAAAAGMMRFCRRGEEKASWMKIRRPTSYDTQTHTPPLLTSDD